MSKIRYDDEKKSWLFVYWNWWYSINFLSTSFNIWACVKDARDIEGKLNQRDTQAPFLMKRPGERKANGIKLKFMHPSEGYTFHTIYHRRRYLLRVSLSFNSRQEENLPGGDS